MAALAWLLIPVAAAVITGAWSSWMGRRRGKAPDAAGVAGYERFRAAMERSSAGPATHSEDAAREADRSPVTACSAAENRARTAD